MYFIKNIENFNNIDGLLKLNLDTFTDFRGDIWTTYTDCDFLPKFVEDKMSVSKKHVLRGLHGDSKIDKLITCLHGEIQLAVLDLRENSNTYGNTQMFHLSDKRGEAIFVPAGCVNGHLCLSEKCIFFYKWSETYNGADNQVTIKWNDPSLNLDWKIKSPILSTRDQEHAIIHEGVFL
jgi:dTDP-4-dehydrorhamnose 3,5-epimerase